MSHRSLGARVRVYVVSIALLGSMLGAAVWLRADKAPPVAATVSLGDAGAAGGLTAGE